MRTCKLRQQRARGLPGAGCPAAISSVDIHIRDPPQRESDQMAVRVRRTQHERAPAHNLTFCEHRGCRSRFYISGRHHCRDCGASVCSAHFVRPRCQNCHSEMPEIPTPNATEAGLDDEGSRDGEQVVPRGLVDLQMCKDVYATSFVLAPC